MQANSKWYLKWGLPVTNGKFFGYSFMLIQKLQFYGKLTYEDSTYANQNQSGFFSLSFAVFTIILFLWLGLTEGQISLITNFVEHL